MCDIVAGSAEVDGSLGDVADSDSTVDGFRRARVGRCMTWATSPAPMTPTLNNFGIFNHRKEM